MPTYTYICMDCHHQYDKFQSITTEPDSQCTICKGKVQRMIGKGIGIIYKGSGFYTTDYEKSKEKTETNSNL